MRYRILLGFGKVKGYKRIEILDILRKNLLKR